MRILWIPHTPLRKGRIRGEHFIERLACNHDVRVFNFNIHELTQAWRYFTDLLGHPPRQDALGFRELFLRRLPKSPALNSYFLNSAIEREIRRSPCDILVVSNNPYLIGTIDFDRLRKQTPILCDFFDGVDWHDGSKNAVYERRYVQSADATTCVSHLLFEQTKTVNPHAYLLRNGVELEKYKAFRSANSTSACKHALDIDPSTFVVSIIGMTCSPHLYFVDAALSLAETGRKVLLLLVGNSELLPQIQQKSQNNPAVVRIEGQVPYEKIMPYFMASDVGLNVVDDLPYYHRQSPLKIFEYAAMGKPVIVAPRLDEVERNALSNVIFCNADATSLAKRIVDVADGKIATGESDLTQYDWQKLTSSFEEILLQTRQRWVEKKASKSSSISL